MAASPSKSSPAAYRGDDRAPGRDEIPNWEDAEHYEVVHHGDIRLLELLAQPDADDPSQLMRVEGWIEGRLCISGRMRANGRWESTNSNPLVYGPREMRLSEYLEESPPRFYFAGGTSIAGGRVAHHAEERITLPPGLLRGLSWRKVDITKETQAAPGLLSIHDAVERFLRRIYPKAWIIYDDARGELADHVVISPTAEDLSQVTLVFVHSKYSSSPIPGQRVEDLDELTGQVMRSRRWIQEGRFLWGDIARRLQDRAATRVLTDGDRSRSALLAQCDIWSTSPPFDPRRDRRRSTRLHGHWLPDIVRAPDTGADGSRDCGVLARRVVVAERWKHRIPHDRPSLTRCLVWDLSTISTTTVDGRAVVQPFLAGWRFAPWVGPVVTQRGEHLAPAGRPVWLVLAGGCRSGGPRGAPTRAARGTRFRPRS